MTTKFNKIFNINGVIDPNQSVMSNLNTLCTAAGCWLTFDVNTGQWAVIINKPAAVQHYFNDSNIIGAINVLGTGLNEFYNRVSVAFNHRDLNDKVDYIDMVIPAGEKFPNETENTLHMEFDCINDPIQAMYLGVVELKQSRLDKVIEFRTDYSAIGLKAGDIIAVTAEMYGFSEKQFRVVKITEEDADNGAIVLSITGIEYSADIYNTSGILREERDLYNGIIPKAINTSIIYEDTQVETRRIQEAARVDTEVKIQSTIEDLNLTSIDERVGILEGIVSGEPVGVLYYIFTRYDTNFVSDMLAAFNASGPAPLPGNPIQRLQYRWDYGNPAYENPSWLAFDLVFPIETNDFTFLEATIDLPLLEYSYVSYLNTPQGPAAVVGPTESYGAFNVSMFVLPDVSREGYKPGDIQQGPIFRADELYTIDKFVDNDPQVSFRLYHPPQGVVGFHFTMVPFETIGYTNPYQGYSSLLWPYAFRAIDDKSSTPKATIKLYR